MFYSDSIETHDGQLVPIGKRDGVKIFEDIEPGETEVLRFGLGGIVIESRMGKAAFENIFAQYMEEGEHEGSFRIDFVVLAAEHQSIPSTITAANYHNVMDTLSSTQTIDVYLASREGSMDNESLPSPLDESLVKDLNLRR